MREKEEKRKLTLQAKEAELKSNTQAEKGPSRWLTMIRKEQVDKEVNDEKQKTSEIARKYKMFTADDSDSDKSEDNKQQDIRGKDLLNFLDNIDRHLQVENAVLKAWQTNDKDRKVNDQEKKADVKAKPAEI